MKTMKDINVMFSAKVAEYISNGYIINADTMNGTQGEIAKIDLSDGKKIIRILVDDSFDFEMHSSSVKLIVGEHRIPSYRGETIWNKNLKVIEEHAFYYMPYTQNHNILCTKEERKAIFAKRLERAKAQNIEPRHLRDEYKKILLPLIRREGNRMKSVKLNDIEDIMATTGKNRVHYRVHVRGKVFTF